MRRVFAGLAAGTMANAAQMLVFAAEGRTSTTAMFASHWLAVGLFHVIVALLFSGVARNRLWSAVVFLFPIATVTGGVIEAQLGSTGFFVFVAGVFAVGAFWTLLLPWRGAPFVSAAGGAAAGALIPYIHFESYLRRIPLEVTLCVAALIVGVAVLTSLLVGRWREWRLPEVGPSIGRIALFGGISIAAFTFQWPEEMTAPPLAHAENRPPVVLIVLDTVRADHLELYGYERKTMPALQRFAHAFGWLYPHRRRKTEELRSVQSDGWKLISSSSGELELYDLHRDPRELVDLSVAEVEQRRVLLEALEQAPIDPARRPKPSPELSDETLDRLRTLGYLR